MKKTIKYIKFKRNFHITPSTKTVRSFMAEMGFDKPLVASLAGIIAISPHIFYTYILKKAGLILWDFSQIGAAVASNSQITTGWPVYVIGTLQNFILAGLFGLIFYYSLFIIGKDHVLIKGVAYSTVTWMVTRSLYLYSFNIPKEIFSKSFFILAYYSGILFWGLLMALLVNKYAFKQATSEVKNNGPILFYIPLPVRKPGKQKNFKKPIKPKRARDFNNSKQRALQ